MAKNPTIPTLTPPFKMFNPLGYWISMAFVPFNLLLGLYLYTQNPGVNLPILHAWGWATVYVIIGLWLFIALKINNLKAIRHAMITGLFAKAYFMYLLLYLGWQNGFLATLSIIDLWGMVAVTQALVVVYFTPQELDDNGRHRP